ncbi:MAG: hypothetical protein ACYCSB_06885 [bacterium]|jgi:hypothetical protein
MDEENVSKFLESDGDVPPPENDDFGMSDVELKPKRKIGKKIMAAALIIVLIAAILAYKLFFPASAKKPASFLNGVPAGPHIVSNRPERYDMSKLVAPAVPKQQELIVKAAPAVNKPALEYNAASTPALSKKRPISDLFKLPKPVKASPPVSNGINQASFPAPNGNINDLLTKMGKGFKTTGPLSFSEAGLTVLGVSGRYAIVRVGKATYYAQAGENIANYEILAVRPDGIKVSHNGRIKFLGVSQ